MTELEKAQAALKEAEGKVVDLTKQVETLTKEKEDLAKQIPVKEETIDKSKLPEAVVKQMEALEKTNKENAAAIEKMQEESITKECIEKATSISAISADGVVVADVLKAIKKSAATVYDQIFTLLKTADARIKESGLFKEAGMGGQPTGATAYDQIVQKATELRKVKPELSDAQAFDRVYNAEHELRKQYIAESKSK